MEFKLNQARELLSNETSIRKKVENERETLAQKWEMVRELVAESYRLIAPKSLVSELEANVKKPRKKK